jgi:hypothetical protein
MKKQGKKKVYKNGSEKTTLIVLQAWLGASSHFPHSLTFWSIPQPVKAHGPNLRSLRIP